MAQQVRPKTGSGIGPGRAVPGGGASHIGGAQVAQRHPMTAAEENARRKPPAPASALGPAAPNAFPWDAQAQGQFASAQKQHIDTNAQIASNRALGLSEFGLDPGYNDYKANPYSQAALLQHNHESNERGLLVNAGQALYSGQTGNSQMIESGRFSQAHQGLVNQQNAAKAGWEREEKEAQKAEEDAYWASREGANERLASSEPEDQPLGGGGKNGGAQKPPKPQNAPQGKKWAWNGSHWHLVKA